MSTKARGFRLAEDRFCFFARKFIVIVCMSALILSLVIPDSFAVKPIDSPLIPKCIFKPESTQETVIKVANVRGVFSEYRSKKFNFFGYSPAKWELIGPEPSRGLQFPDNLGFSQIFGQRLSSPSPWAIETSAEIRNKSGEFYVAFKGTGAYYRIAIFDGRNKEWAYFNSLKGQNQISDGSLIRDTYKLQKSGRYSIRIEFESNFVFFGIGFDDKVSFIKKSYTRQNDITVAILGDSFSEPTLSSKEREFAWQGYPQRISLKSNLKVTSFGSGGTGYLKALGSRMSFIGRIEDIVQFRPRYLLIAGGINDLSYPRDEIIDAARQLLALLRERIPQTTIILVSPFWPLDKVKAGIPEFVLGLNSDLLRLADRENVLFLDLYSDLEWLQQSKPFVLSGPDGTHPNSQGHRVLADLMLSKLCTSASN